MSVRFLMALAAGLALASTATAQNPPAAKKADPTAEMLSNLRAPIQRDVLKEMSLNELAQFVSRNLEVTVLVNAQAFRTVGQDNPGEMTLKPIQIRGTPLNTILNHALAAHDATFLVRKGHIEIVPVVFAAKETKNLADPNGDMGGGGLKEPLVSVIFKEKPLNEAVAELAEEFDLNVVVSPQSADAKTGFVNARLLNVPADKALELLAVQCDLRVIRKGNAFLITSRDHANEMFAEKLERERAKIELEKFRLSPPPKPEPVPEPKPEPKVEAKP